VGLVLGDPAAPVKSVLVTLDSTVPAIERAEKAGANVIVTHHPPFMSLPRTVTPANAEPLFAAGRAGIALVAAHTNLDRAPEGAGVLLEALDLAPGEPIETQPQPTGVITVYVEASAADSVRHALAEAGAGRIGSYEACSFTGEGIGRFTPGEGATPAVGTPHAPSNAREVRIDAVCSSASFASTAALVRAAHPYEEPLITFHEADVARGAVALGRYADLEEEATISELVSRVADAFSCTPRVWGSRDHTVSRLATGTGSASSLVGAVVRCRADALLAGEVRYHDALDAVRAGVAVIEAGHDVTEWPLVPVLADAVMSTPGMTDEHVIVEEPTRAWWTP
jgi:putative NIF3 family GTP cyclohydrolase 1 type 2